MGFVQRGGYCAGFLLAVFFVAAQEAPQTAESGVRLPFSIVHRKSAPLPALTASDFRLREGRQEIEILAVQPAEDMPLRLVLLIDTSRSTESVIGFYRFVALEAMQRLMRPDTEVSLAGFNTTVDAMSPFTADLEIVKGSLARLQPKGGTALYDALHYVSSEAFRGAHGEGRYRHAIVLISDGGDNYSSTKREEAVSATIAAGAPVYVIAPRSALAREVRRIERVGLESGGAFFIAGNARQVERALEAIRQRLEHRYELYYRPPTTTSRESSLRLELREKRDMELSYPARP